MIRGQGRCARRWRSAPSLVALALLAAVAATGGCALAVKPGFKATPSQALPQPVDSTLGRTVAAAAAPHADESGFVALADGVEAFVARVAAIDAAEKTLDLQYYIVHDGLTTKLLLDRLLRAADRGVRVRFLLDDTSSAGDDFPTRMLAAHPNIEVRLFNPLRRGRGVPLAYSVGLALQGAKLHRRMHNKALIADNAVAVVGGRNLGDEYFGAHAATNFADLDLLAVGPVVAEVSAAFDVYWNDEHALPVEAFRGGLPSGQRLARARREITDFVARKETQRSEYLTRVRDSRLAASLLDGTRPLTWGRASAVYDDPAKVASDGVVDPGKRIGPRLAQRVGAIERELLIVSPYFIPQDDGTRALTALARAGVKVTVLTNSLEANDVGLVHDAYTAYRVPLLEGGVRLFEMRARPRVGGVPPEQRLPWRFGASRASLHTKAMVFDRRTVFVGSMNFDPRSLKWNTELGLVVESPALAESLTALFERGLAPDVSYRLALEVRGEPPSPKIAWHSADREGGDEVRRAEPAGLWTRFVNWFLGLIAPEDLL